MFEPVILERFLMDEALRIKAGRNERCMKGELDGPEKKS